MKVLTVVGTRPELIRLSRVIAAFDRSFDHVLVHTGQNYDYELNEVFFDELEIRRPDFFLQCSKKDPAAAVGDIITKSYDVILKEQPDAFVVLGDTNSCLAAYAAKRLKVPVFHMEAGNRCFDQRVPEEINRRIVDVIADVNLPYSQISREYLISEGFDPRFVVVTGSPMLEVIKHFEEEIDKSTVHERFNLNKKEYLVASIHREENVDNHNHLTEIITGLNTYCDAFNKPLIFSTHPRTRKVLEELNLLSAKNIIFTPPLGFFDYISLQRDAACVISDSGTIFEESSILNMPAVSVRNTYERPEAYEVSAAIVSKPNADRLYKNINLAVTCGRDLEIPRDYSFLNVSNKMVKIVASYTDIVNTYNWHIDD